MQLMNFLVKCLIEETGNFKILQYVRMIKSLLNWIWRILKWNYKSKLKESFIKGWKGCQVLLHKKCICRWIKIE